MPRRGGRGTRSTGSTSSPRRSRSPRSRSPSTRGRGLGHRGEDQGREGGSPRYNAATGEFIDMVQAGIVGPTKVVARLQHAASIMALLLTTEAIVTDIPKRKRPRRWVGAWSRAETGATVRPRRAAAPRDIRGPFALIGNRPLERPAEGAIEQQVQGDDHRRDGRRRGGREPAVHVLAHHGAAARESDQRADGEGA